MEKYEITYSFTNDKKIFKKFKDQFFEIINVILIINTIAINQKIIVSLNLKY